MVDADGMWSKLSCLAPFDTIFCQDGVHILIRLVAGIDCGPHGRQGSAESITHLPPSSIVRAQQAQQCTYNVFFLYPKEHLNIFLRLKLYRGFILYYLKLSRVFQNWPSRPIFSSLLNQRWGPSPKSRNFGGEPSLGDSHGRNIREGNTGSWYWYLSSSNFKNVQFQE